MRISLIINYFLGFLITFDSLERGLGDGFSVFCFIIDFDSKLFTELTEVVVPYFLIELIVFNIAFRDTPIALASSHTSLGLASDNHTQNAGFASCQNIIPPQVTTQASHFASGALRLDPAICACIFFPE